MRQQNIILLSLMLAAGAAAQPVVAPTGAPLGTPRGENMGGYNTQNSFEVGYRWRDVTGSLGKYRSDVNFGNGLRLLGSSLSIHSREGQGGYFDEILLNTQGLGNDPYQSSTFRIQKNRLYRYDLLWRENAYYNPALYITNGQHLLDTTRRLQDHNITLFPQGSVRLLAGYSRNSQSGPALSTIQLFDSRGDEFPLFSNVRRLQDQYRVGAELNALGYKLFFMREWEFFRDDTEESGSPLAIGNNPDDRNTLTSFRRTQPFHGSTRSWRVHLLKDQSRWLTWNGRFAYAAGRRNFLFDENILGADRFTAARARQTMVAGDASRPVTAANLTITVLPGERFTVVNHTAYNKVRMSGDGSYSEVNNQTLRFTTLNFELLDIRTLLNTTDATYQLTRWAMVHGGYQFSKRRIRSIQQESFDGFADRVDATQDNTLKAGVAGLRLQPLKPLTVIFDAEIGRADRPIYPISERNYHAFSSRVQYRTRTLTLAAAARTNYNTNSVSLATHSSRSRSYWSGASWNALTWFGFDASYSKIHLDTATGIAYFAANSLVENDKSIYISNIHLGHLAARFSIRNRVDLFAGFSHTQDTGDGRSTATAGNGLQGPPSVRAVFAAAQAFPLSFTSPMARVSVRLHERLRWNAGYQHYNYREEFGNVQDYRAHTGFTSLSWSF